MSELGNYQIGSQTIGQGTFGKVCLAKHKLFGFDAAVKILEKKKIQDDLDLERVKREITILQMLSHPNVVQLYEMTETETHLYLFMEYAEGGELYEYIDKKKRINEVEACKFMHQIISAIQYIHQLHIVHRDLKPENLLLTAEKNILVVDFGLSNTYEDTLKTACGSPCYAAPEMIQGKPYHGLQTDIWSCGVIMYAMLCGYLPFEDSNTQVLYKKILTADFHIPRYVSLDGKDLIKNILTVDPTKRYTIEQIRSHKWWQLWKSDSLQLTSNHKAANKIQCNLLKNSMFSSCMKKNIERNISEDVKTCCDTFQESIEFHTNDFINKSNIKTEEQTEKNQFEFLQKQNILTTSPQEQVDESLINEVQDQYEFQQSLRSLTRQKSSQSIQSIKHLQTQIDSPQKPITLNPVKNTNTTVSKINKTTTVKKPIVTPQQITQQKKPITKAAPSKSLHEPPSFDIKFLKQPQTPSSKQTNLVNTSTVQNVSHSLKTEIPKKNSIPPVKLGIIQEQLKENKEKSHSLKTQPNSYKQQQQLSQTQQQKVKEKLETEISNFDQRQSVQLNQKQAANFISSQFKTPIKQQQTQISATKKSLHQKQAASVQIDRQSFHTQVSVLEDSNQFQLENTKLMVEKFMLRLNNVKIVQNQQKQKQYNSDSKNIENLNSPFNLSFTTTKHPQLFMKEIQKYLFEKYQTSKNSIQCNGQYQFNCQINEIQVEFKLLRIENSEVYYCQILQQLPEIIQNQEEFNQIIQDLQYNIKF